MRLRPFSLIAVALAVALAGPLSATAAVPAVTRLQVEQPRQILFVGNSYMYYNDSLHNHVRKMAIAADPALEKALQYKSATIGGAPLSHHDVKGLLEPGRLGLKGGFDVVILQGHSAAGMSEKRRASFREKVVEFNGYITAAGARTALYMTHAYVPPHKQVKPDMTEKTAELYVSVGNEVGALVIPVGLAFEEAYRRKPDIKLHKDYDGSHPELIGTYLAACVVYASLYGKSPVGNPYDYHGRIDKDTAAFLQRVAEDTVKKFYGR